MKNSAASKMIIFLLLSTVLVQPVFSQMNRPAAEYYPNPYTLMKETSIEFDEGIMWYVLSNRINAPICKYPGMEPFSNADYLELFSVQERKTNYLKVKSMKRENVEGWMDMKHLILLQRCIKDPDTKVYHKIFIKANINIKGRNMLESGLNSLRFRNGPGEGGNEYNFLTSSDEIVREGGLFFYLYGVHFNDETINYQDTDQLKNADYFLIGDRPSFSIMGNKFENAVIRGWIPRQAAVLWDTRQALEVVPDRPLEAHKFMNRPLMNRYFAIKEEPSRKKYLAENADEIIIDKGERPPEYGQELRNIILGIENKQFNVTSEYIGYIGQKQSNMASHQSFLADLHVGASNIEIFFLIGATESMNPCMVAVSRVAKKIMTRIEGSGITITFNGAVYRDVSEGIHRYEAWDPIQTSNLLAWFNSINAYTNKGDPDYEGSLLFGTTQTIKGWKTQFKHPLSVRVLVILGDTGDNGKGPSLDETVSQLKEGMILPLAIHFKHQWINAQNNVQIEMGMKAMSKFPDHIKSIYSRIYGLPKLIELKSVEVNSIESELEKYISAAVNSVSEFIKQMPRIRLGQTSIKDQLCEMAYKSRLNDLQGCKSCNTQEEFLQYLQNNPPEKGMATGNSNVSFFLAYLKNLERENPELKNFVMIYPEAGFCDAYIALKEGNKRITRPVLLLSLYELQNIRYAIEDITLYRYCEDSKKHQLLVKAMATILGEVLQVNPDQVTREDLQRWFKLSVAPETNFLGVQDILAKMCSNRDKWTIFLKRLETAKKFIENLESSQPEKRLYRDLQKTPYFWVYPEEIFPPFNED